VAETFRRQFEMSWIHHENALDGVVLTEQELVQALEHQVVGDASLMSVVTSIRNHHAALDFVRTKAGQRRNRPNLPLLEEIYKLLARGNPRSTRLYRQDTPIHRTYSHEIAAPDQIEEGLEKLFKALASAEFKEYHPIRQAAHAHWQFMQVFPFADHNGRVARLLQTFYLLRAGYPPAIIHQVDRQRYHDALRQPPTSLRRLLVEALDNSLLSSIRWVERLAEEAQQRTGS